MALFVLCPLFDGRGKSVLFYSDLVESQRFILQPILNENECDDMKFKTITKKRFLSFTVDLCNFLVFHL